MTIKLFLLLVDNSMITLKGGYLGVSIDSKGMKRGVLLNRKQAQELTRWLKHVYNFNYRMNLPEERNDVTDCIEKSLYCHQLIKLI